MNFNSNRKNSIYIHIIMHQLNKILIFTLFITTLNISLTAQKTKEIFILNSDVANVNEILMPNIQILKGAVVLKHDSAIMFCDSAYFNSLEKSFRAFGKIHVQSPTEDLLDTVELWGDSLHYSGIEKLARVRSNVILKKDSMTLYTDFLDYNISEDIGKYYDGGRTINGEDTLISKQGFYYANEDELFFKEKVQVFNPKYTMLCDTLKHNTKKKISFILGPTNIVSTDTSTNYIYCENGWYNHNNDIAQFKKNALLVNGKQTLQGDSLFYNRKLRLGRAFNNVTAIDSGQNVLLTGNYGEYNEVTESSLMTKNALFIQIQKGDSLFLHADTLLSIKDTLITKTDTTAYTIIKGFHKVKMFKSDFQSKCDSLVYTMLDSVIELHRRPIMWSDKNQITAKFIKLQIKNDQISQVFMNTNAMIVSQSDSVNFDQIRGKNMVAYLDNNKLRKINVKEDGALIYFGRENENLSAINKLTCTNMMIYLYNGEVDTIWFYENPEGMLYPPGFLEESDLKFDIFEWNDSHRPKKKDDVFIWTESTYKKESKGNKKQIDRDKKGTINENFNKKNDPNKTKTSNQNQRNRKN